MKRQINSLSEAANYMYQFIEQLNDVRKNIQREDENNEIDLNFMVSSENLCNRTIECILNQIDIIKMSGTYLKEINGKYETEDIKKEAKKEQKENIKRMLASHRRGLAR